MSIGFGQKLKRAREVAGLSQTQLGEFIGMEKGRVSMIESGLRPFPVELVNKLPDPVRAAVVQAFREEIDEQIADLQRRRLGVGN